MEKLNLTPEEILNKEFNVYFKGYSPAEVDSFLDSVRPHRKEYRTGRKKDGIRSFQYHFLQFR